MAQTEPTAPLRPAEVIERYGKCLELIPMDAHFHDITVALFVKDGICTVWTFSRREGVAERMEHIPNLVGGQGGWNKWPANLTPDLLTEMNTSTAHDRPCLI